MKEFKYTIDGKEYKVVINSVNNDNIADITVNGEEYKVQMERIKPKVKLHQQISMLQMQ